MKSGWREIRLGDYIDSIASGPFGSSLKVDDFISSGTPVLDGANLKGFKVTDNITKFVSEEKAKSLHRSIAKHGEIIVTIRGTIGQIAYIPYDSKFDGYICCQSQFRVAFDERIDVPFLVYFFHSTLGQRLLLSFANQVGVPALSQPLKNFPALRLSLPLLATQRRIAAVLSSLDDKIELNRKMNANLEAQAQALFKSWFVDFEPWGGQMPTGWKMGKLSEIAEVCYGKDHKALKDGSFPVYGSGGVMRYAERPLYEKESVLIPRKGTLNNIMYSSKPFWTVDTMFYTKTLVPNSTKYLFLFLHGKDMMSLNVGSAVPSMTTSILNLMEILIPDEANLTKFENTEKVIFDLIAQNDLESRKLAELRDTLLPKLMSGQLEVAG